MTKLQAIGMDAYGRLVVVVYAWRGEKIRIISARKATKQEQKYYGSKLWEKNTILAKENVDR